MDDAPIVKTEMAFRWECPQCGRENFDRCRTVVFDNPEDEAEAKEKLGIPEEIEGGVCSCPETFTCLGCLLIVRPDESLPPEGWESSDG